MSFCKKSSKDEAIGLKINMADFSSQMSGIHTSVVTASTSIQTIRSTSSDGEQLVQEIQVIISEMRVSVNAQMDHMEDYALRKADDVGYMQQVARSLKEVKSKVQRMLESVARVFKQLLDGIRNAFSWLKDKAMEIARKLQSSAQEFLGYA